MTFETFQERFNEEIYKAGDIFWVCDVRENEENPMGSFRRKLKPTKVICLVKNNHELYFVKPKKDGKPSKSTISIYGPTLYAKPFNIFETQADAEDAYSKRLKEVFMNINKQYDAIKATCGVVLGGILKELQELNI